MTRLASRPALSNGTQNKVLSSDSAFHEWYRFVLSFPPHLVRDYLQKFDIGRGQVVLDPFCGTGTTVVECKRNGIGAVGLEANPMAHFASSVKTYWCIDGDELEADAKKVTSAVRRTLRSQGIEDGEDLFSWAVDDPDRPYLRALPEEKASLLLKDSISPLPLHKTLVLLEKLSTYSDKPTYAPMRLALAKALVATIGNLHFGPEVGLGEIKDDAFVLGAWLGCVRQMADDLRLADARRTSDVRVLKTDARNGTVQLKPRSIHAVITSPPYPNEKDYTRTTRLESVLLGFINSKAELRALKKTLVRSNTRGVYVEDQDHLFIDGNQRVQKLAREIEDRRIELGKTSGFERLYARVTKLYFGGMARHLDELKATLAPGAKLAYVVGDQASYFRILIRTGEILAEIAEDLGYKVVGIDLFRTRLATATKAQLREEVVVLEWNGGKR
jgi:DNA modification methylase